MEDLERICHNFDMSSKDIDDKGIIHNCLLDNGVVYIYELDLGVFEEKSRVVEI